MEQPSIDSLNIEDDEADMQINVKASGDDDVDLSICLVGRFLTDRNIRVPIMKERMADVWRPLRGVTIYEIESALFLFRFYHAVDFQHVLKGGPWSFDKHMLILGVIKKGENPKNIPLYMVPFWVQIHNIPVGFMSQFIGENLENYIGKFLEYDEKNNSNFLRSFMRIRVMMDVQKPLKKSKRIKKPGGEATEVQFRYERLSPFYYLCGLMGHIEDYCEKLLTMVEEDSSRSWGPELRAEVRKPGGAGGSWWLRDGGDHDGWNPTSGPSEINATINFNHSISAINDNQLEENICSLYMVDVFKNPQLIVPIKSTQSLPVTESNHDAMNVKDHGNQDLIIIEKKRRMTTDEVVNDNDTMQKQTLADQKSTIPNNNYEIPFLLVGPGMQAHQGQ